MSSAGGVPSVNVTEPPTPNSGATQETTTTTHPPDSSPRSSAIPVSSTPSVTTSGTTGSSGSGAVNFFKKYSGWSLGGGGGSGSHALAVSPTPVLDVSSGSSSTLTPTPAPNNPSSGWTHLDTPRGVQNIPMSEFKGEPAGMSDIPEHGPLTQTDLINTGDLSEMEMGGRSSPGESLVSDTRRPDLTVLGNGRANRRKISRPSIVQRPCPTHSFHTDATEVQHMEKSLLGLLEDFNSGKLRAFGQGCSMEKMEKIRDQQESLAKLHFELGARQDIFTPLSDDGLRTSNENMEMLMERLEKLSMSIAQLNPSDNLAESDSTLHESGMKIGESSEDLVYIR